MLVLVMIHVVFSPLTVCKLCLTVEYRLLTDRALLLHNACMLFFDESWWT